MKVVFLSYLIYKIIMASVPELLEICYGTIDDIFPCLKLMLKRLAYYTAFGYIVIAVVDRLFQGRNFTKEMMMTIQKTIWKNLPAGRWLKNCHIAPSIPTSCIAA